ncbi:hypothetical protein NMY22_g15342 [Coprinellus aureogranulatus]|nr:hypothetical protein NMY22_g15342 [Coprinellus aureogranulatus]
MEKGKRSVHHTPIKKGSGSGNFTRDGDSLNAKPMRSLLKEEISAYYHSGIDIVDIAVAIWGVPRETANKILELPLTLDQAAVESYKQLPTEGELHQPFVNFAEELLQKVHSALHPNEPFKSFKGGIWDKEGNACLKNGGRTRKPDMLQLWQPLPEGSDAPWWGLVKHIIEMKHDTNKVVPGKADTADPDGASLPTGSDNLPNDQAAVSQSDPQARPIRSLSAKPRVSSRLNSLAFSSTRTGDSDLTAGSGMVASVNVDSAGTNKRNIDEVIGEEGDEDAAAEEEEQAVKRRKLAGKLKEDHLQLATYAVEAMSATCRNWVAGILVDTNEITVLLLDRHMVARTTSFNFDVDVAKFALMIYAMTHCNRLQAGFDPHLRASLSTIADSKTSEAVTQEPEERPVPALVGSFFEFPLPKTGQSEAAPLRLKITGVIRQPDDLISRGTMVYKVKKVLPDGELSDEDYALKLSWPLKQRTSEIDVIEHLKAKLPSDLHVHLPGLDFSTSFSAEQLSLPWTKLSGSLDLNTKNFQERTLRAMLSNYYIKLWEAGDPATFRQAWLDCVECHYAAFKTGKVLHRDLSENNLMLVVVDEKIHGVVNDWDMAKFEGLNDTTLAAHHRTGTPPFMAIDLLYDMPWGHLYRYDLESLFYILVWAAIHYNLKKGMKTRKVQAAVKGWISNDMDQNADAKTLFFSAVPKHSKQVFNAIQPEFREIKDELIMPLYYLFSDALASRASALSRNKPGYNYETCGDQLTFETFMEAIKATPRWASPTSA